MTAKYLMWRAFDMLTEREPVSGMDLAGLAIVANVLARLEGETPLIRDSVQAAIEMGAVS